MSDHGIKGIVQLPREVAARIRQRGVRYFARGTQLLFVLVSVAVRMMRSDGGHTLEMLREREREREREGERERVFAFDLS